MVAPAGEEAPPKRTKSDEPHASSPIPFTRPGSAELTNEEPSESAPPLQAASEPPATEVEAPSTPVVGTAWRGVLPAFIAPLSCGAVFVVSQGSVVRFRGDALVNAANRGCLGGGGVDGAVNDAGGFLLEHARRALPIVSAPYIRCPTGEAKLTVGGALRVRFVIHAVGPGAEAVSREPSAPPTQHPFCRLSKLQRRRRGRPAIGALQAPLRAAWCTPLKVCSRQRRTQAQCALLRSRASRRSHFH
jgi:hypothetical protein